MTADLGFVLRVTFFLLGGTILFLWVRYIWFRLGFKDSKYTKVQHSRRKLPPEPDEPNFLPGSRSEEEYSTDAKVMEEGLELTKLGKKPKKGHYLFRNKKELRRDIIIDDLLDQRWKKQ